MYFVCSTDIHVDVKPVCDEAHPCTCKRPYDPEVKGCGEECLNRYVTRTKHLSQPVFKWSGVADNHKLHNIGKVPLQMCKEFNRFS